MPAADQCTKNVEATPAPEGASTSRKVRLLVAHNISPERTGGMGRIMGFIHDEIARSEDWEIDWFCADRLGKRSSGPLARLDFPRALCRYLRQEWKQGRRYDVINVHEPVAALPVAFRRFFGNPRMVVTSHGLEARAWEVDREEARLGRKPLPWRSRVWRPLSILWPARFALRRADHVFCLNSEDQQYLAATFGVPQNRSTRLIPGVAPVFASAAAKRTYDRATRLLFAGTWRHHKGIDDLVAAFIDLVRRYPSLTLTVLGSGLGQDIVLDRFPVPLRRRIEVISSTRETEAAQHFAQADLFVLPSLFEGTPLTLIEAMASGLPTVTTETCGMRDVIRHGGNGLLVPTRAPGEIAASLETLLESQELREKLGRAAARDAAEHYQWTDAAAPALRAYRTVLSAAKMGGNS